MPKEIDYEAFLSQILQKINEIDEKSKSNKNKIDLVSQSILSRDKKINEKIDAIKKEINKIKNDLDILKQRVDYIINEFPNVVRREDLTTIERFIKLWQPLKFVTLDDVEKIIEKKLKKS